MEFTLMSIDVEKTGGRIKSLRERKGYSVNELRCAFGFREPQSIYKWEAGRNLPSLENLLLLGHLFDCHVEDILVYSELGGTSA